MKSTLSPVEVERATEQIRQERETFDQQKSHSERWFKLRLTMGYSAVVLLAAVMVISGYILMHPEGLPSFVLTAASGALFVDVVGLLVGVWRISMNPRLVSQLAPVTDGAPPKQKLKKPRKTETPRTGVALPSGQAGLMTTREPSKSTK